MGNRTERGGHLAVINPPHNPYLHVVSFDQGATYRYVASLHGMSLKVGRHQSGEDYTPHYAFDVPLLSAPAKVPPEPIETHVHVAERVASYAEDILAAIKSHPGANILASSHGVYWGFLPEQTIAQLLKAEGYRVETGFPRVGGRKRIQEHGILFQK